MNHSPLTFAAATTAALTSLQSLSYAAPKPATIQPNIVHILTDDLGWMDPACYYRAVHGKEPVYETPNMDRLAANGRRFMQAYSPAPTCAPSRAAFLTGRYGPNNGVLHVMGGLLPRPLSPDFRYIAPFYASRVPLNMPVIPQVLKQAGYTTAHIKKFHAGGKGNGYPYPVTYGFDFSWERDHNYNDPDLWDPNMPNKSEYFNGLWLPQRPNRLHQFATDDPADPFRTNPEDDDRPFDGTVDLAQRWMEKVRQGDKPFFLNYCTSMVHGPLSARDRTRFEHYCRKLGIPVPTTMMSMNPTHSGQINPYYATMVDTTDWLVGRLVTYLEETDDPRNPGHKLIDNTYVILSSDNGGCMGIPIQNEAGHHEHELVTDNAPLRGGKQTPYEGGVRTPFIVRGPGVAEGAVSDAVVSLIDLFPTFMAMAGLEPDPDLRHDGCDLLPVLLGRQQVPTFADGRVRESLFFHYPVEMPMASAIRKGNWKLYRNLGPGVNQAPDIELFRLLGEDGQPADVSEAHNLAGTHPDKRDELLNELNGWLGKTGAALPYKNPHFNQGGMEHQDRVPSVTGRGVEDDTVWVTVEAGEDKSRIVGATLLYTVNPQSAGAFHQANEEWFEVSAQVLGNRVEAKAPPGMTHGVLYLRDEHDFLITSEPLPPVNEVGYNVKDSQILKDGFAYRPGLVAMQRCGDAAVNIARKQGLDTARLQWALAQAAELADAPVNPTDAYVAMARIRNEIRRLGPAVPEAGLFALNQFELDDLSGLNLSASGDNPPNQTARQAFDGNPDTKWLAFTPEGAWIQYAFAEPVRIPGYAITSAEDAPERDPKDWQLLGSNDGKSWTTLDRRTGERWSKRLQKRHFKIRNNGPYRLYRLDITAVRDVNTANSVQIGEIEFTQSQ